MASSNRLRRAGSLQSRTSQYSLHTTIYDKEMHREHKNRMSALRVSSSDLRNSERNSITGSITSFFRRSQVTFRFEVGSQVEVSVKGQWLPGKVVALPSADKSGWARYSVQCDPENKHGRAAFGKVMASDNLIREPTDGKVVDRVSRISFASTTSNDSISSHEPQISSAFERSGSNGSIRSKASI
jgi:hypothetical protein